MTHLGQQISALIDGELDVGERERVLVHISRCGSCQDEAAALRTLKRRMNALGEAAAGAAGAGLTVRLMGLSSAGTTQLETPWPPPAPPGGWPHTGHASRETRTGRYFLAGSLVVFLAGIGTAAFIAGGEPQPQAPAPPVAPSVDVQLFARQLNDQPALQPRLRPEGISPLAPRPGSRSK
jgi:anti-sigma factor RsiW